MIVLKTSKELQLMKEAGAVAAGALKAAGEAVRPGITTFEIDRIARKFIEDAGAYPTFLGYNGYPAATCISINDVVIHGIPSKSRTVKEGDIVSIDIGATYKGYVGDNADIIAMSQGAKLILKKAAAVVKNLADFEVISNSE